MQRFLPSLWLFAAVLYVARHASPRSCSLRKGATGAGRPHETVRAKQPVQAPDLKAAKPAPAGGHAIQPSADAGTQHRNEWVQVASYTTVVHARPSSSSPVISAYPIGQQLRVIARESGFARVQDLGSGHLGWIAEAALVPRMRGYRVREPAPAEPQVVAAAEPSPPPLLRPTSRWQRRLPCRMPRTPRGAHRAPIAEPTVIPITETRAEGGLGLGLFRRRDQAQLIPARARSSELARFFQRAISGR